MTYQEFIDSRKFEIKQSGFICNELNQVLFDYQKKLVKWALKKGKCALFTGTGTGKTVMQCEWAYRIFLYTNKPILILAPLAVSKQTVKEAKELLKIDVKLCESQNDIINGINITNYEKLQHFDTSIFIGIVLDESSILKSYNSVTRNDIIERFSKTPYKLACTATPAPNDYMELGNHSEFLNELTRKEMLAMFFIHDMETTQKWRLKGHAANEYWAWIASWAAIIQHPSDLGFNDVKYKLPELYINEIVVKSENAEFDGLFMVDAKTLDERRKARRNSINERLKVAENIVNNSDDIWLVWCDLNSESDILRKNIKNSIEVKGSDTNVHKENSMLNFSIGKLKCLISKPSICGFGMNFQVCHNMIFFGISDSFESYFQSVRRCYRFGQKHDVNVYIITSEEEGAVLRNIQRKEENAQNMIKNMIDHTKKYVLENLNNDSLDFSSEYNPKINMNIPEWLISEEN